MKKTTLRCSSLPQFMSCAPSELNPEGLQEVHIEIEAAELGTLVHEFNQRIVETGEYNTEELKARKPEDLARAHLLISNFFSVWNEAKQTMTAPSCEIFHEVKLVETDKEEIVLSGHIDVCQMFPESAFILDYKTGRLHDNHFHQIAGYSYLLWDLAGKPDSYKVSVSVVYLEDLSITNYTFTADQLKKWRDEVVEHAADTRYTVGKKCAFCKIQGSCPAYREYTQAAIKFFSSEDAQKGKVAWKDADPAERGSLLDVLYVVKKGTERVQSSLKTALGDKKGATLDLGDGTVYTRNVTFTKVLNVQKALPLLRQRFKQELLDEITGLELHDVLDLIGRFAPPKGKTKAKEEFLAKLDAAGCIDVAENERCERRTATEKKLNT